MAIREVPVAFDDSTVAITSLVTAGIAYGFCRAFGLKNEVSLLIAGAIGIAFFANRVIPVGLLVVVGIAAVSAIFKWLAHSASRDASPDDTNLSDSQPAKSFAPDGSSTASASEEPRAASTQDKEMQSIASMFCQLTLNSPDDANLAIITSQCPMLNVIEKARLRLCLSIAQAALFLLHVNKYPRVLGSTITRQFELDIHLALRENDLDVVLEDYVLLHKEIDEILLAEKLRETSNGNHSIRISDLMRRLRSIRHPQFLDTLEADLEGGANPFLSTSRIAVRQFLGRDPSTVSYGSALTTAISAYLSSWLASIHKTLSGYGRQMNRREQQIRSARELLSDERLIAFLHAADAMEGSDVFAVELICKALNAGKSLDDIFYDGNDAGYMLSVGRISSSDFKIEFGHDTGALAGDGGEWKVSFNGDKVQAIGGGRTWIS